MTEKEAGLGTLNLLIALYSLERIFLEGTEARNFANSEGLSKIYIHLSGLTATGKEKTMDFK